MGLTAAVLLGMGLSLSAAELTGQIRAQPSPLAALLSTPEVYEGRRVVVEGTVAAVTGARFPNGKRYYTFLLRSAGASVTVFLWHRPAVKVGDVVQVTGTFHVWRYNIHQMIEGNQIVRTGKRPMDRER